MRKPYILSIDQGTTGTTCICFDDEQRALSRVNREFTQHYPRPGWVEHNPEEIWQTTLLSAKEALEKARLRPADISAVGITNQRETIVLWERETGKAVRPAIVWQCRRSADICARLKQEGKEELIHQKTGLLLDPYFSGTKLTYVMENEPDHARLAAGGELAFGTIDTFLLFRLTGGRVHATDFSNASRTLLFNLHSLEWDRELLDIFQVPAAILPAVHPSSHIYGITDPTCFLGIEAPIGGVAGDQQAALFGQACFHPGMTKNTYGTGSFVLMNIGKEARLSRRGLLTTVAWGLGGEVYYALEGSIFITGAAIQWLRDGLGVITQASEMNDLAASVEDTGGVYFVPAFVGLGAPYWDPEARALAIGMTRGTDRRHFARAVVESMAYQTADVIRLMQEESGVEIKELRVDGGASVMDFLLQFQADLLRVIVRRPTIADTTALGAALLAGLATGVWEGLGQIEERWKVEKEARPREDAGRMNKLYQAWKKAVERSLGWAQEIERSGECGQACERT